MTPIRDRVHARPKVLMLIKGLGLGGAERLLVDALPYLNRARFDYRVGYLMPWKRFLVQEIERAGIPVYCLGGGSCESAGANGLASPRRTLTLLPGALRRLLALQRRQRFDVIHADLPMAGILARLVSRWSDVPVVYTEHNLQERYHAITRWVNAATYGWNRRVLAVSGEVAASIERFGLRRRTCVVTLPNAVPVEQVRTEAAAGGGLRAELKIPEEHLVVGTVAVFRRQKRLADWLKVASRVATHRADVTFLLVGSGPLEADVRAQIEALGLTDRVRTPGFRPDGRRLMSVMDVYLMTSEFEGLPVALLEAMALAKPVVSTAVGGIPEVLEPGMGFLAPVGAVGQLGDYVIQLLDDADRRARMGAIAAAKVESAHHVKGRVEAIEQLYNDVLQESSVSLPLCSKRHRCA